MSILYINFSLTKMKKSTYSGIKNTQKVDFFIDEHVTLIYNEINHEKLIRKGENI